MAADACPYANICEQCDNYTTSPEFRPQLQAQLADTITLREDAEARGWDGEAARHDRLANALQRHLDQLERTTPPGASPRPRADY